MVKLRQYQQQTGITGDVGGVLMQQPINAYAGLGAVSTAIENIAQTRRNTMLTRAQRIWKSDITKLNQQLEFKEITIDQYKQNVDELRSRVQESIDDPVAQREFNPLLEEAYDEVQVNIRNFERVEIVKAAQNELFQLMDVQKNDFVSNNFDPLARNKAWAITEGHIRRMERTGALPLPRGVSLEEYIDNEKRAWWTDAINADMRIDPRLAKERLQKGDYSLDADQASDAAEVIDSRIDDLRKDEVNAIFKDFEISIDTANSISQLDNIRSNLIEFSHGEYADLVSSSSMGAKLREIDYRKKELSAASAWNELLSAFSSGLWRPSPTSREGQQVMDAWYAGQQQGAAVQLSQAASNATAKGMQPYQDAEYQRIYKNDFTSVASKIKETGIIPSQMLDEFRLAVTDPNASVESISMALMRFDVANEVAPEAMNKVSDPWIGFYKLPPPSVSASLEERAKMILGYMRNYREADKDYFDKLSKRPEITKKIEEILDSRDIPIQYRGTFYDTATSYIRMGIIDGDDPTKAAEAAINASLEGPYFGESAVNSRGDAVFMEAPPEKVLMADTESIWKQVEEFAKGQGMWEEIEPPIAATGTHGPIPREFLPEAASGKMFPYYQLISDRDSARTRSWKLKKVNEDGTVEISRDWFTFDRELFNLEESTRTEEEKAKAKAFKKRMDELKNITFEFYRNIPLR